MLPPHSPGRTNGATGPKRPKAMAGICVRGRFGFQYIDSKARLRQPLVRKDSQLVETPWLETMDDVGRPALGYSKKARS